MSQALTIILGAEYIRRRGTLILYGQINITSLGGGGGGVPLTPRLPVHNVRESAGGQSGEGKERRTREILGGMSRGKEL